MIQRLIEWSLSTPRFHVKVLAPQIRWMNTERFRTVNIGYDENLFEENLKNYSLLNPNPSTGQIANSSFNVLIKSVKSKEFIEKTAMDAKLKIFINIYTSTRKKELKPKRDMLKAIILSVIPTKLDSLSNEEIVNVGKVYFYSHVSVPDRWLELKNEILKRKDPMKQDNLLELLWSIALMHRKKFYSKLGFGDSANHFINLKEHIQKDLVQPTKKF